jgi:hypothetical protein
MPMSRRASSVASILAAIANLGLTPVLEPQNTHNCTATF